MKLLLTLLVLSIFHLSNCQNFELTKEKYILNSTPYQEIKPSQNLISEQFDNLVCGMTSNSLDLICDSLDSGNYFINIDEDFIFIRLQKKKQNWNAIFISYKQKEMFSYLSRSNGMKHGYSILILNKKIQLVVSNNLNYKEFEIIFGDDGDSITKRTYFANETEFKDKKVKAIIKKYYRNKFYKLIRQYPFILE